MPADLLRYLAPPTGYSAWWWLVVGVVLTLIAGWYAAVITWTLPPTTLRRNRVVGWLNRRLVARRFAAAVQSVTAAHRTGAVSAETACHSYTRILRSFLRVATGTTVHHLRLAELGGGPLAGTAPLFEALNTVRFGGADRRGDVEALAAAVEGTIRAWN